MPIGARARGGRSRVRLLKLYPDLTNAGDESGFFFPTGVQGREPLLGIDFLGGDALQALGMVAAYGLFPLEHASLHGQIVERAARVFNAPAK